MMSSPTANDSTAALEDRTTQPHRANRGSNDISFQNSLDAHTVAAAQVARLAYRHYDIAVVNSPDDLRRALPGESPYPDMIMKDLEYSMNQHQL